MFVEDLSVFFDVDVGFALTATWTPAGGPQQSAPVILDEPSYEALDVVGEDPTLLMPTDTFAGIAEGDTIQIGATDFVVRVSRQSGDGRLKQLTVRRT